MDRGIPTPTPRVHRRRLTVNLCVAALVLLALVASLASLALAANGFPDVPSDHPYYVAIGDLSSRGIINGYTNGNFGPGDPVTRQQFAKMIVGTGDYPVSESDICPFPDVVNGGLSTFYPDNFVAVCAAQGITVGKTATTFDPYAHITRYQVITMVVRAADDLMYLPAPPAGWTSSAGWETDPTHGANAARAECNGLLTGLQLDALNPYGDMTRGEVAQVLHNFLQVLGMPPVTLPSITTVSTLVPSAAADLMFFWWTATDGWKSHNISEQTNQRLVTPVAYWWAFDDWNTEHLAGMAPDGDLVLFWDRQPENNWKLVNVSDKTGQKIDGPPTYWLNHYCSDPHMDCYRDNLAALNADGEVIHFWWSPQADWQATNVTQASQGPKITGKLTSWCVWDDSYDTWQANRIAGRSTANDLIVFGTEAGQVTWQAVNVSEKTGEKIDGSPVYWLFNPLSSNGAERYNLVATSPSGDLLLFWWSEYSDWQVLNMSEAAGGQKVSTASVGYEVNDAEHVAARAANGDLIHFWRELDEGFSQWHVENLTQIAGGPRISGEASYYRTWHEPNQSYQVHLVVTTPSHDVVLFVGVSSAGYWSAGQPFYVQMRDGLVSWGSSVGGIRYNHIAGLKY